MREPRIRTSIYRLPRSGLVQEALSASTPPIAPSAHPLALLYADPDTAVAAKAGMLCVLSSLRTHAVVAVSTRSLGELAASVRPSSPAGAEAVLGLAYPEAR